MHFIVLLVMFAWNCILLQCSVVYCVVLNYTVLHFIAFLSSL